MSRITSRRRIPAPRLLLECLEDRTVLDVAISGLVGPQSILNPQETLWNGVTRQVVPGSWMVQFSNSMPDQSASLNAALSNLAPALQVQAQLGSDGWYRLSAPGSYSANDVAFAVRQVAPVLAVNPVFADYTVNSLPNDQFFPNQGSFHNAGGPDINAPAAWGHTGPDKGSTAIVVAVNDTGVDYTHPDLYLNIWINQSEIPSWVSPLDTDGDGVITFWDLNDSSNAGVVTDWNNTGYIDAGDILLPDFDGGWSDGMDEGSNGFVDDLIGWDFVNNDNDPFDNHGHGTHVAGTIGATGNNGTGVAGVVWKTQLMVVGSLNGSGSGNDFDVAAGMNYAVDNGARITNTSWSGPFSALIDSAAQYASGFEHLIVAPAGNDSNDNDAFPDNSYPASLPYDNILSVGATDGNDNPASFTNYGATTVDLMAPGNAVLCTMPTWFFGLDFGYGWLSGTSQAAPHVAGAAALLWASESTASMAEIRDALLGGVDLLPVLDPSAGSTPVVSGGRLNIFGALQYLHPNGLFVLSSSPAEGEVVTSSPPTEFTVTFNAAVQLSTFPADLQASDLFVNGVPATGVTLSSDGLTATFTYSSSPITSDGVVSMQIVQGSLRRADTNFTFPGLFESNFSFVASSLPLEVIDVNPASGTMLTVGGPYTFRMFFNQQVDPGSIDISQFEIWIHDAANGNDYLPASVVSVLDGAALDVTFTPPGASTLLEGSLVLHLNAGTITGLNGNPNPDAFQADFTTDLISKSVTAPLPAFAPLGSLTAGTTLSGYINPGVTGGDGDDFTISLSAGQNFTLFATPGSSANGDPEGELLLGRVELYNSADVLMGFAEAGATGQSALLQSMAIPTTDVYTIRVKGLAGSTGRYHLTAVLNASTESEGVLGTTNDTRAAAQLLNSSFIGLSTDLAQSSRGAVIGQLTGSADLSDFFAITAKAGERIGLAIAPRDGGSATFSVALIKSNGNVMGEGQSGATNLSSALDGKNIPADGTYYVRVTGTADVPYTLVVTRDVLFDREPNDTASTPQRLNAARGALGYIDTSSDWFKVKLSGDQTALQLETRTPGNSQNTLNPRIEVYKSNGTTLVATGTALADGRNEKILVTGLKAGASYKIRVLSEGGTTGEYYLSATPLRVPTITSKVDDALPGDSGPDGSFCVTNPAANGWASVTGAGWQNDYTVHQFGVNQNQNNVATWQVRATSKSPELFVTWVPRPTNATNATYQVFKNNTLLATVVVDQTVMPNDSLLFGNTFAKSLGEFSGIKINSFLTVKLLTQGANGDVVADGAFDPPTGSATAFSRALSGLESLLQALSVNREETLGNRSTGSSLTPGHASQPVTRSIHQVTRDADLAIAQHYQTVGKRSYQLDQPEGSLLSPKRLQALKLLGKDLLDSRNS